ncbi:hypothetical protein A3758_37955 [Oleiphilus sp. HI0118]|nr:hypothetical protein A3744_35255 [Oleiphilus sp. HI0073]KZZ45518.1 hypothetical protein A3758_37955 [Oleiphilus sp. HI0118]
MKGAAHWAAFFFGRSFGKGVVTLLLTGLYAMSTMPLLFCTGAAKTICRRGDNRSFVKHAKPKNQNQTESI